MQKPNHRYRRALWIEQRVGQLVCVPLLAWKRLFRRTPPPAPEPRQVERILVLKMWGMGSIVVVSGMFRELRQRYPNARIDFLTLAENRRILELYPEVDRILTLDLGAGIPRFLLASLRSIWQLRRERYDVLLDLEFFTRFSAIFSFLIAAGRSHGFSDAAHWRGRLHDVEAPFNGYNHVLLNFLTLLRGNAVGPTAAIDVERDVCLPLLEPPEEALRACRKRLAESPAFDASRPTVVINANAGDMALERRWPAERVIELADALVEAHVNVVFTGAPSERAYVDALVAQLARPASVINLAGATTVAELVALFSEARVVVSNDSGPVHIAAAAGASTVALFGPETPVLYRPLLSRPGQRHEIHYRRLACSPCMFVHDNKVLSCWASQAVCMTGIRADAVLASVSRMLEPGIPR